MHSLRRLWLAKLSMIHEIKFAYGPGKGEPGPVDDWTEQKKAGNLKKVHQNLLK